MVSNKVWDVRRIPQEAIINKAEETQPTPSLLPAPRWQFGETPTAARLPPYPHSRRGSNKVLTASSWIQLRSGHSLGISPLLHAGFQAVDAKRVPRRSNVAKVASARSPCGT